MKKTGCRFILLWMVFVITMIVILSSCVTQKKCLQKFPPQIIRERYDSIVIKDTIIYKDRIRVIVIPADTVYKDREIPGILPSITTKPMVLENDYVIAKAWIQNSRLKMQLEQKGQVLKFKLDSADKEVRHWKFEYLKIKEFGTQIIKERYIPKIYKYALYFSILVIIIIGVWVFFKIKTGTLNALVNKFIYG